ncbi:rho GTPase-activating protein [Mortierella claussenii]|nr:rho GTPase-activating protein [Mortierella claussenii]
MSTHPKKEPSAKNSSSLANMRSVIASQAEATPRKTVSHEGFQKSSHDGHTSTGNATASLGDNALRDSPSADAESALPSGKDSSNISNSNNNNSSGASVSAFSYFKARLFGSVADASTSFTSSARDLLQSKKSSDVSNGSPLEPSFGGRSGGAAQRGHDVPNSHHYHPHHHSTTEHAQQRPFDTVPGTMAPSLGNPTLSPNTGQHSPNSHRFFSRTLPSRRQAQPEPSQLSSDSQHSTGIHSVPPLASGSGSLAGSSTTSPNTLQVPSPTSAALRSNHTKQRRISAVSQSSNTQKHLSTSSVIFQEGYLNKKIELHSGESGHGWKVYKVVLKSSKLYFYKPMAGEERPHFQDPKDHRRQYFSPNSLHRDLQGHHHQQHSSSSGIVSPRLSITSECGMVLSAFNFESSTKTLLFEGNAKSLGQGTQAFAPPVTKYVYGECFTEIDRVTMQFKKHVALLLFEDSIIICKRKWMRYTSTKVKDVIKFSSSSQEKSELQETTIGKRQGSLSGISYKSGDSSRGSDREHKSRSSFDQPAEKQRGYFTKWKHEASYPLSQVEALDLASPVPSSSATFYPFVVPATATVGSTTSGGRGSVDSDNNSVYTSASMSSHTSQMTSTLELVITSHIDGKDFTHRLLYLPPSQEVRHRWYSKFNRTKELHQAHSCTTSKGRESLGLKDTLLPRSPRSNQSTVSLHSPTSPTSSTEAKSFVLNNNRKMERTQVFCETTAHPELISHLDEVDGSARVTGASINGFIHELVHGNYASANLDLIDVFTTTYPLFTTTAHVLKELKRCIHLQPSSSTQDSMLDKTQRVKLVIQGMLKSHRANCAESKDLEEIQAFVEDVLQDNLSSATTYDVLKHVDRVISDRQEVAGVTVASDPSYVKNLNEASVDLSNVLITGLTPALFLKLEAAYFAEQVLRYHWEQFQMAGGLPCLFANPAFFMRRYPTAETSQPLQSVLIFSMHSPHFLTVLITHHILIATQSIHSASRRPKLLAQWIRTAQCSRALGDLVGFVAIATGICSPGVVRLQETWKQVPLDLRQEVAHTWVPLLIKIGMVTEELQELAISAFDLKSSLESVVDTSLLNVSPVIPCVCNVKQSIDQIDRAMPSFLYSNPVPVLNIEKLGHIHSILGKAMESLQTIILRTDILIPSGGNGHLQQYFSHLASISHTLHDQYRSNELSNNAFESSLACEPYFNGQYLDYHYKNRKMTGSFIPLMFPEVIPEKRLFPLPLLLTLENTGNTDRKSSLDDVYSLDGNGSKTSLSGKRSSRLTFNIHGSTEWSESSATHHGMTDLSLAGASDYSRPRKRTYSFPPARHTSSGVGTCSSQPMVNMINPHLDAIASGCLLSINESELNGVVVAMRNIASVEFTAITVEDGDLVLKVKEEKLKALVKATTQDQEDEEEREEVNRTPNLKKPYANRNTASSSIFNKSTPSVISDSRRVMVKAGTLDALIHVAVMGLEGQSGKYLDERGDLISWSSQQLALDHEAFMRAFFATYRSYCTAHRLLERLVTMFTFAQHTKIRTSGIPSALDLFSGTTNSSSGSTTRATVSRASSSFEWRRVLGMQRNILKVLEFWLKAHVGDFLNDLTLKAKVADALKLMSSQEVMQRSLIDDSHSAEVASLSEKLAEVKKITVQQMMKPLDAAGLGLNTLETFFRPSPSIAPSLDDAWTADHILDQLNTAAWGHFVTVREQEWIILFEILESQSADPLGWYLPKSGSLPDEELLITGIHNTLYTIRRNGTPGTRWNGERLLNSLPLCLQSLCKLHHIIRGWVILQIASPSITYEVRLSRVQKMLDIILLSRQAMRRFGDEGASPPSPGISPTGGMAPGAGVPSFVENAVVSALISPESRAYTRVWLDVAASRKGVVDTLEDVLASQRERDALSSATVQQSAARELVPAVGWLIERMLETCCYVRDMSYESPLLINFDKRQYVYDLVQVYVRRQEELRVLSKTTTSLSSWLGLSTDPSSNLAMKVIREAAQRETASQRGGSMGQLSSAGNGPLSKSRPTKIFSRLLTLQQEKMRRDQKEYDKLEKLIKDTQGRIQRAQQEQAKTLEKQIKLDQSRSRVKNQLLKSTLMRAMRPISLAITNSWSSATTTVSNATALGSAISGKAMGGTATSSGGVLEALGVSGGPHGSDTQPIQIQPRPISFSGSTYSSGAPKPVLVINLINSTCSIAYTYTKRDFVFKIVTEEGGQSLLQALDYEDMLKWIKVLNEAAAEATAKRRTLLDSDESLKETKSAMVQADDLPHIVENERKGRSSVYGIELHHLMSDGQIPLIVEKCITEIEKRGLEEVGIYRVPGAVSSINKLRLSFNSGSQNVDLESDEWRDINVVAGALKQFLRELPEAVMTSALYDSLIAASALEDYDERLLTMKDLIHTLPAPNYLLLKRVVEHLERVTDYEEINHMYATNLAIVFGPTLLRPGGTSANSFATSMKNLGHQQNIVRNMILQYHWLFDVEDDEGGDEGEDEEDGLGEFPEILEDSDEDDYEVEEQKDTKESRLHGQPGVQVENDDDVVLVLAASQPSLPVVDLKEANKDKERSAKSQRRKTIVFG